MTAFKDDISEQFVPKNFYPILISFLVVLICGASIFALIITDKIASKHAPLIDITMEMKLEVTLAHLYVEEYLTESGNRTYDDIVQNLNKAKKFADLVLFGGLGPDGTVLPINDEEIEKEVSSIKWQIEALKILADNRIHAKQTNSNDRLAESEFDGEYRALFSKIDTIENKFHRLLLDDNKLIFWVESGVVFLVLIFGISAWLIFVRYENENRLHLKSISEARQIANWARDKLSITLDSIGDAVIATDLKGVITRINPMACKMTGWSAAEAIGIQIQDVLELFDLDGHRLPNPILEVLTSGKPVELSNSAMLKSRDGSIYQIADSATIIKSSGEELFGAVMVFRDVTDKYAREQMIRESEEKYSRLFRQSNDAILLHDMEGNILDVNDQALTYFYYTRDEMLSLHIVELHPESEKRISQNAFKTIMKNGSVFFEVLFRRKDGTVFPAEVSSSKFKIGEKDVIQGIVRDISQRRKSQQELVQLATLVEQANQVIFVTDLKGNIEYANPFFEKVTGYSVSDIIGKNANLLRSGKQDDGFYKSMWKTILAGETWSGNFINKRKDGTEYHEEAHIFPIKDETGEIVKFATVKKDITLQVKAQEDQKESEDKYKNIFFNSPIGIIHYSSDGTITECNNNFCLIFGITPDEVVGTNLLKDYSNRIMVDAAKSSLKMGVGLFEGFYQSERMKEQIYLKASFQGITDRSGSIIGGLALVEDLTDWKKADEAVENHRMHLEEMVAQRTSELESANNQLADEITKQKKIEEQVIQSLDKEKELNELKTNFISTVSHEFRTPLTTILTSADLIELYGKDWDEEKLQSHINKIQSSVENMKSMLEEMLSVGKSASAERRFNPQQIDLKELCGKIIEEHKLNNETNKKFSLNFTSRKQKFNLDIRLVSEIVNNLISNAVKYTGPDGEIELLVSRTEKEIVITVKDNGIGIPAEEQKTIFEPFSRGSEVSGITGTGLGLTIVKNAVELHNGKIECTSMKDVGTTFIVKLPHSII